MNFIEAMQAVKGGAKIRLRYWKTDDYYYKLSEEGEIVDSDGDRVVEFDMHEFLVDDWVIYKKTDEIREIKASVLRKALTGKMFIPHVDLVLTELGYGE